MRSLGERAVRVQRADRARELAHLQEELEREELQPGRETSPAAIACQSGWPPKLRRAAIMAFSSSTNGVSAAFVISGPL